MSAARHSPGGLHWALGPPSHKRTWFANFFAKPRPNGNSGMDFALIPVNKRPRLTPRSFGRSMAWLADRRQDPMPINRFAIEGYPLVASDGAFNQFRAIQDYRST